MNLFRKNNYLFVYLVIIGCFNIYLQTLPLTNVFGYEFSAVNGLLLSFLSGLFIIKILKSLTLEKQSSPTMYLFNVWFWMLILPFAISVGKSILFGFCSFWDGLWFYIFITGPSVIIGSALGSITYVLFKRFRILIFIILYLLILFIPVLEIYFNPQVYLFNPLFSYFPGTIYDEGIAINFKLILYRLLNIIFFLPILIYFIKSRNVLFPFSKKLISVGVIIFISGIFYFFISHEIGFNTTQSSLQNELSIKVESEHFIIHADKRIDSDKLIFVALNQENYYLELKDYFKESPGHKIITYLFFDDKQKKNLFGSGSADVAKPWLYSIYISNDSWESTLKHEIAHCFTAEFGSGIFKLASGFNPSLIEGVAEAADGFYDENSIHYLASLAFRNNFSVDINSLFEGFSFFSSVSSLSYIYSGSFIKYLVDDYGIEKVKAFYQNGNFNQDFNSDLSEVISGYEKFLESLNNFDTKAKANYYFGRKPLISKVCPRYISSSLAEAWEKYSSSEINQAEIIFNDVLSKAESYGAIIGLSTIYKDQDSLSKAIQIIESNLDSFNSTSYEYNLKLSLADLLIINNEIEKAKEIYQYIKNSEPNRRLLLISNVRLSLLKNGLINKYVNGSEYDKYEILKALNKKSYVYSSIPLMIDLSQSLNENYDLFLLNFADNFEVKDEMSSYALYKLSNYMMQNQDYDAARRMAGFSLRFKGNPELLLLCEKNFNKADWFVRNAERTLQQIKIDMN